MQPARGEMAGDATGVFIADDHELLRWALRTLLEAEADMFVVGEAGDGDAAVSGCSESNPGVVLLDLHMPGLGGIEVLRDIRACCPDASVLVLTDSESEEEALAVTSAGACGYILKNTRPERIVHAVRSVADGQSVFDTAVANRIVSGRGRRAEGTGSSSESLSEREMEVLHLMAKGLTNKQIGRALWIGETTVKTHVGHILRKLDQADRTQAVLAAVKGGIVQLED
jgi:DNA-binding NarL/FixJ family response regulator